MIKEYGNCFVIFPGLSALIIVISFFSSFILLLFSSNKFTITSYSSLSYKSLIIKEKSIFFSSFGFSSTVFLDRSIKMVMPLARKPDSILHVFIELPSFLNKTFTFILLPDLSSVLSIFTSNVCALTLLNNNNAKIEIKIIFLFIFLFLILFLIFNCFHMFPLLSLFALKVLIINPHLLYL